MGRRIRHIRGKRFASRLTPQHRDDLLAQQVQLLEHRLQRQPGVVDEERLALVVAEMLPEGERLLDHFLRTAYRERGLRG